MYFTRSFETLPFHLIWISLSLVYGLVLWSNFVTGLVLGGVAVVTGFALGSSIYSGFSHADELFEIPLMTLVFLALVWHVRRRQAALATLERVAVAERHRGESREMFVRLASHELRTPLTVIRGYTELVKAAHPDPETDADTGVILDEVVKLQRITNRLVTLLEVSEPPVLAPYDLDELLERTLRRWRPTAVRVWFVDSAVGVMVGSPDRLETALDTLLENAVKFTEEGDRISLLGRREGEDVLVEVVDSGHGIPSGDLPYVVEPFRVAANSGSGAGTGLGLHIVRTIVQARGGSVSLVSPPGGGTTVSLRFPSRLPDVGRGLPLHGGELAGLPLPRGMRGQKIVEQAG